MTESILEKSIKTRNVDRGVRESAKWKDSFSPVGGNHSKSIVIIECCTFYRRGEQRRHARSSWASILPELLLELRIDEVSDQKGMFLKRSPYFLGSQH